VGMGDGTVDAELIEKILQWSLPCQSHVLRVPVFPVVKEVRDRLSLPLRVYV
jgi:hypothetical protein